MSKYNDLEIVQDYKNGMDTVQISEKHGCSTSHVFPLLKKLGIKNHNRRFTEWHLEILKEKYATESWDMLESLTGFDKLAIQSKASDLGLRREFFNWSKEDEKTLSEAYSSSSMGELLELFPRRTQGAIQTKASKMGLAYRFSWTDEMISKLKELYPYHTNKQLLKYFSGSTERSIQTQAGTYNLRKQIVCNNTYTKDELLDRLIEFAEKLGRTPVCTELGKDNDMPHSRTYDRYFGTYRKALLEAGLEPVQSLFATKKTVVRRASNGDLCYSKAELKITEFFLEHEIEYEKEVLYKDVLQDEECGNKRCDWLLPNNIIVEFFGMPEKTGYSKRMQQKRNLCEKHGFNLLELYRKDLNKLNKIFKSYLPNPL